VLHVALGLANQDSPLGFGDKAGGGGLVLPFPNACKRATCVRMGQRATNTQADGKLPDHQRRHTSKEGTGISQLSLVEHALCPLDSRTSLRENLRHESEYRYTDVEGRSQLARAVVHCPVGLSPGDEFYLWGLLALCFAETEPRIEFQATPHFCLRKLGLISPESKGGKSYRLFRDALRRLSAVRYQNERFYDPIRREHRDVSFGLFSYSLPLAPESSRAWRIVWDPLFFDYCQAAASQLRFDLEVYRKLDHASRRLFLLLSKVFWRRPLSPCFDVRHLAIDVLGFSANLATRTLRVKVSRCADVLQRHEVLAAATEVTLPVIRKQGKGRYAAQFVRGSYFKRQRANHKPLAIEDSPLCDPLRAIGFDAATITRILARHGTEQIQLWADVTLAAMERKGASFFRRSPQAFFMNSIQNAARGQRTPPEWFWTLRQQEQQRRADHARRARSRAKPSQAERALDLNQNNADLTASLVACFLAAGQSEADAQRNARRLASQCSVRRPSQAAK
jgi:hypothetical protein